MLMGSRRLARPYFLVEGRRGRGCGARSNGRRTAPFVSDRPLRVFVPAWVLVVAVRESLADLYYGKHAAHLHGTEWSISAHHGEGVVRQRHFHLAHVRHAALAHHHVIGNELDDLLRDAAMIDPNHR